ncbi:MAG TPA: helix-turn-helix transcriptional regulator [Ktedonobacteraceae bacterium]|jgi:DNA-binding Xre family transcriptional regulator|nr:helix-turn-helix transcriptional regulator [Ktedonobacteraceae bacterium]
MAKLIIKYIAEQQGLNQSQLQLKAAVTSQLLSRYWKNKTQSVELGQLEQIARALGVRPGDLIVPDEELAQYEQELEASETSENTEEAER